MNATAIDKLMKTMRSNGVMYLKTDEIEIRLDSNFAPTIAPRGTGLSPKAAMENAVASQLANQHYASQAPAKEEVLDLDSMRSAIPQRKENKSLADVDSKSLKIPHHINTILSTLKMTDEDLLNLVAPMDPEKPDEVHL